MSSKRFILMAFPNKESKPYQGEFVSETDDTPDEMNQYMVDNKFYVIYDLAMFGGGRILALDLT